MRTTGSWRDLPEEAVVLSTGDPMLSGLGYLKGRVIPGISSMQVACARLKVSQLKVVPITVHGRSLDPDAIAFELRRERCVFLLTDDSTDLRGPLSLSGITGPAPGRGLSHRPRLPGREDRQREHGLATTGSRSVLRSHWRILRRKGSRIAALAGKITLSLRILRALEIDPVLRLYLQSIAAIR